MKLSWKRRLSVYAGLGTIAIAVLSVADASVAGAQTKTVTFKNVSCKAVVNGSTQSQAQDISVTFIAPDTVAPGSEFTVTIPGGSSVLPSVANGLPVNQYSNLSLTYQIKNATFKAGSIPWHWSTSICINAGTGAW